MLVKAAKHGLKVVPDGVGFPLLKNLAARIWRHPATPAEREALSKAVRFSYAGGRLAWSWGSGPLVVVIHGWSGSGAQVAPLAQQIAARGFRAVSFDVTGHGLSSSLRSSWTAFFDDIGAVTRALGEPVYAYVGHSAGALSMMASRGRAGVKASRYVSVCAPSYPFPPLEFIQRMLEPSAGVMAQYRDFLARQFECPWEVLEAGACFAGAGSETLLIFDVGDRVVPHGEGDKLRDLCPGVTLRKLGPYGHTSVLRQPELGETVADFLLDL